MRLALVTRRFDLIGGAERYAGALARGLAERGHAVRVLCEGGAQEADVERIDLPALGAGRPSRSDRRAASDAVRDADAVLVLSTFARDLLRALADAAPTARHVQDHTLFCPGKNKLRADGTTCREPLGARCLEHYWLADGCAGFRANGSRALRRPLAELGARLADLELHRTLDALVCGSRYVRDQLVLAGCDPARVHSVPYFTRSASADLPRLPLDGDLEDFLADGAPLVLAPARLVLPDKGIDYLITALGELRSPFRCVVAGDGPARAWLERKTADEGLADRVRFAGWIDPGRLETLYARSAVVAFPSVWDEPFGLVGLEAGAHARPVVAFDVGGVSDWLVDGETGLRAPNRDAHAFACALDSLLADPVRAAEMGHEARDRVARDFSRERHLERVEAVLASLHRAPALRRSS